MASHVPTLPQPVLREHALVVALATQRAHEVSNPEMMMNPQFFLACATLCALSLAALAQDVPAPEGMKLVWSDEFNVDGAPDAKNWTFETGFARNEENQWYQSDNASVKDGLLIIEARREQKPNPTWKEGSTEWRTKRQNIEFTSSSLSTNNLHSWTFGRFEMRAKIPTQSGMWPAFWTVGQSGEWPAGGEIDIMEFYRGKVLANVAWGTDKRWNAKWNSKSKAIADWNDPNWSQKFHTWAMDWDAQKITLSVDGQVINTQPLGETVNGDGTGINPFLKPQFILLNLALGGQNGGDLSKTEFPARYEVDYVRVYQKP